MYGHQKKIQLSAGEMQFLSKYIKTPILYDSQSFKSTL